MRRKGFTLIELLIVMAVIGILVSVAMYSYTISLHKTKLKADVQSARILTSAVLLYEMDNGELPDSDLLESLKTGGYVNGIENSQTGGEFELDSTDNMVKINIEGLSDAKFTEAYDGLADGEKFYVIH